jgi:periplasmic protein TonB
MKNKYAWLRRLPVLVGIGFGLLTVLGVWWLASKVEKPPQSKKLVQQITMIQPPAPQPPEQQPAQPEEVKEEVVEVSEPAPEPEPSPEPDEAPPAEELGLDAEGAAGSDGFGLAAHKGGRSILGGGGGGGNAILWYGGQIQRQVENGLQSLLADTVASRAGYSVTLEVWVGADGGISRSELSGGSGKTDVDQAIRAALPRLRASIARSPPENMPQPIRIRLNSRV